MLRRTSRTTARALVLGSAVGLASPATVPSAAAAPSLGVAPAVIPPRPAAGLGVGDPAPPLSIAHVVKGEPLDGLPEDRITVVEFWATWCRPCIANFPHLSALQERYAGDVVVIGVSDEKLETVERFLARPRHADATRYRMATDPDGSMHRDWMAAAGQRAIPCAFVVDREGIVRFVGHPASGLDETLARLVGDARGAGGGQVQDDGAPAGDPTPSFDAESLFAVDGEHTPAAAAQCEALLSRLAAPGNRLTYELTLSLPGAMKDPGGGPARDLEMRRQGELVVGPEGRRRLDGTRTMDLPALGEDGVVEEETVLVTPERFLLRRRPRNEGVPASLPGTGWLSLEREEARELDAMVPAPLPTRIMLDANPWRASPLAALDGVLELCALEVADADEARVVLTGRGAPFLGVPRGPDDMTRLRDGVPVRLEIGTGEAWAIVGDPQAPTFRMALTRTASGEDHDPSLFTVDAEPTDLAPLIRRQIQSMRGMSGG